MSKKIVPILDTKCVAPYVSTQINASGLLKVCCEYKDSPNILPYTEFDRWWNSDLDQLRKDLNNNVQHELCSNCWNKESIDYHSYRNNLNQIYKNDYDNYDNLYNQSSHSLPKHVHLNFGNMCNLRCIMCHPAYSSSLHTEVKLNSASYNQFFSEVHLGQKDRYISPDANYSSLWFKDKSFKELAQKLLKNADRIFLTGGEPLMSAESFNTINEIENKKNIDLVITTNGTLLDTKWFELFVKFKSINITVSLEGIDRANNYLRHGSDWTTIDQNIKKIQNLHNLDSMQIATVIQHTSYYTISELLSYADTLNIPLNITLLFAPEYLSINTLTKEEIDNFISMLKSIDSTYNKSVITSLLNFLTKDYVYDSQSRKHFFAYVAMLDSIRGTNFKETFNL